jgi:hypothetical protein
LNPFIKYDGKPSPQKRFPHHNEKKKGNRADINTHKKDRHNPLMNEKALPFDKFQRNKISNGKCEFLRFDS